MSASESHEVTQLLLAWRRGDQYALERLIPIVYAELRRIARRYMRRQRPSHTLQTTALVNEAYLRLIDVRSVDWQNRAHFFAISAMLMRQILVDRARERGSKKRGGGTQQVDLDEAMTITQDWDVDLIALDEALTALSEVDGRKSQVVEMRFFGGLQESEVAVALNVSTETVRRDWRFAKSWLLRRLREAEPAEHV